MDDFDIVITNFTKRTAGLMGSVVRVHNNGVQAKMENGETVTLRNSNFDYLSEKIIQQNSSQPETVV